LNTKKLFLISALALTALFLSACGGADPGASSAVLTEAALIYSQSLTQTAAVAPPTATATPLPPTATNTPVLPTALPTITGTPPTSTPAPTQQSQGGGSGQGCLRAELAYETPPDGYQIEVTENFKKRWVLKNIGTCPWTPNFALVWQQGDLFGAKSVQPFSDHITLDIQPGDRIDISVNMIAPGEQGSYRGYWMIRSDNGVLFGLGPDGRAWFWVDIYAKN
jgi:hypothetical protein